jgi:hypothetical protein
MTFGAIYLKGPAGCMRVEEDMFGVKTYPRSGLTFTVQYCTLQVPTGTKTRVRYGNRFSLTFILEQSGVVHL